MEKTLKIVMCLATVATSILVVLSAAVLAWMLVPWTGATEAVRSVAHALLSAGIVTAAVSGVSSFRSQLGQE